VNESGPASRMKEHFAGVASRNATQAHDSGLMRLRATFLAAILLLLPACATLESPRTPLPPLPPLTAACMQLDAPAVNPASAENALPDERVTVTAQTDHADELIERGWRKSLEGDRATVIRLYARALNRTDATWRTERIHWSYGWAMFNLGDYACALAHFERSRQLDPSTAAWLPQTLAVTYWQLGQRETALEWLDAAAHAEPGCWADARAAVQCTRHWQAKERRALGELLHARKEWKFK
jgi:tetratricopeptide (TPR) repeat protein